LSGRESALLAAFVVLLGLTAWLVIGVATNGERRGSQGAKVRAAARVPSARPPRVAIGAEAKPGG
jgi:hypothetical protein